MKEISLPFKSVTGDKTHKSKSSSKKKQRLIFAACFCAVSGILCGLIGFLMTFISILETDGFRYMNSKIGSLFVFAAFPLFFLAAHLLDRIDDLEKKEKPQNSAVK